MFFQPHYGPGGSTQPLTEMNTRNLPGGKGRPACKADLNRHLWADSLQNVGASTPHSPMGLHGLLQDSFTLSTITNANM
jgi:hypothetical protein